MYEKVLIRCNSDQSCKISKQSDLRNGSLSSWNCDTTSQCSVSSFACLKYMCQRLLWFLTSVRFRLNLFQTKNLEQLGQCITKTHSTNLSYFIVMNYVKTLSSHFLDRNYKTSSLCSQERYDCPCPRHSISWDWIKWGSHRNGFFS